MDILGKIHSVETCGTLDGPGIRYVIFFQGCPLRCQYCHNPDTWKIDEGKKVTVDELMEDIIKYKSFMKFSGGGVTASGGEALIQHGFLEELFKRCKEEEIHTALDTSGCINLSAVERVIEYTDLVLLDIKSFRTQRYKELTGASITPTLEFAKYLSEINKPMWVRYVLVPGLTDDFDEIEELAAFLGKLQNIEKVEILPFHKMGEYKWEELGYEYKLKETDPPDENMIEAAKCIFKKYELNVF
ncbi:pyruvate formate-lyase-activating protein [Wukongibacter baidiensis]|uniref:pyruvate formate-lyase-activating protein n=1 Tax=Wukongibacter baidiensis TaxID=1723361 RepID=UPI003D7FF4EC